MIVGKDEWMGWITSVYRQMRRPGLPGTWNHALLLGLFNTQSIGEQHAKTVHKKVTDFIDRVLFHVVKEDNVRIELGPTLPITYHYYLTDNADNARQDRMRDVLRRVCQGRQVDT